MYFSISFYFISCFTNHLVIYSYVYFDHNFVFSFSQLLPVYPLTQLYVFIVSLWKIGKHKQQTRQNKAEKKKNEEKPQQTNINTKRKLKLKKNTK